MAKKTKETPIEKPADDKDIDSLFPETGISDFEKKVAADSGLDMSAIKTSMDEPSTTEEAIAKIMGNLVLDTTDRRKLMSDLSPREIHLFSVCYARANIFKDKYLEEFLDQELMLRVSKKRGGRNDIIKVSGAIRENEIKRSWWRRMNLGMGGGQQQGTI